MKRSLAERLLLLVLLPLAAGLLAWPVCFFSMRRTYTPGVSLLSSRAAVRRDIEARHRALFHTAEQLAADESDTTSRLSLLRAAGTTPSTPAPTAHASSKQKKHHHKATAPPHTPRHRGGKRRVSEEEGEGEQGGAESVQQQQQRGGGRTAAPPPPPTLLIGTSLKSCEAGTRLCDRQWNSLRSWTLCPGAEVHIFASREDAFDLEGLPVHARVVVHRNAVEETAGSDPQGGAGSEESGGGGGPDDPFIVSGKSKIPLLSSIVRTLTLRADNIERDAEGRGGGGGGGGGGRVAIAFANADIVFPPHQLRHAVELLAAKFTTFFAVGHRKTVEVQRKVLLGPPDSAWSNSPLLQDASREQLVGPGGSDRTDAEDYFLWSNGYFADAKRWPGFRIGRPAFDNWLVHKAITSGQPVVDLTHLLTAVHQKHDYAHIKSEGGEAKNRYWKTHDQEQNYALGKANGGWRFGLIEFSPFRASPPFCGDGNLVSHESDCRIEFSPNWHPPQGTSLSRAGYERFLRGVGSAGRRHSGGRHGAGAEGGEEEEEELRSRRKGKKKKRGWKGRGKKGAKRHSVSRHAEEEEDGA